MDNVTGRDGYIITKALAYAIEAIMQSYNSLNFISLNHGVQDIVDSQFFILRAAYILSNSQDASKIVRRVSPLRS